MGLKWPVWNTEAKSNIWDVTFLVNGICLATMATTHKVSTTLNTNHVPEFSPLRKLEHLVTTLIIYTESEYWQTVYIYRNAHFDSCFNMPSFWNIGHLLFYKRHNQWCVPKTSVLKNTVLSYFGWNALSMCWIYSLFKLCWLNPSVRLYNQ